MFRLLIDPSNLRALYKRLTLTATDPADTLREGSTFRSRYVPAVPSLLEFSPSVTVSEFSEPSTLVLSADPWLRWEWTIAETSRGSLVQLEHRFKLIWSSTFGDVLGRILTPRVQRDVRTSVEALGALAEASTGRRDLVDDG